MNLRHFGLLTAAAIGVHFGLACDGPSSQDAAPGCTDAGVSPDPAVGFSCLWPERDESGCWAPCLRRLIARCNEYQPRVCELEVTMNGDDVAWAYCYPEGGKQVQYPRRTGGSLTEIYLPGNVLCMTVDTTFVTMPRLVVTTVYRDASGAIVGTVTYDPDTDVSRQMCGSDVHVVSQARRCVEIPPCVEGSCALPPRP